jgi:hypothetical protein
MILKLLNPSPYYFFMHPFFSFFNVRFIFYWFVKTERQETIYYLQFWKKTKRLYAD